MNLTQLLPYVGAVGLGLVALYQLLSGDATDAVRSASIAAGLLGIHLNPGTVVVGVGLVGAKAPSAESSPIPSRPDIAPPAAS